MSFDFRLPAFTKIQEGKENYYVVSVFIIVFFSNRTYNKYNTKKGGTRLWFIM
jgi:hypothetical protein